MSSEDCVRELYRDGLEAFRRGDQARSRALNQEALELARAEGDRAGETLALVGLSRVEFREGDNARVKELALAARDLARATAAERLFTERRELRDANDSYERAMDALNDAALAVAHGDPAGAEARLRVSEETLAAAGIVLDPDDRFELEWLRARLDA